MHALYFSKDIVLLSMHDKTVSPFPKESVLLCMNDTAFDMLCKESPLLRMHHTAFNIIPKGRVLLCMHDEVCNRGKCFITRMHRAMHHCCKGKYKSFQTGALQ